MTDFKPLRDALEAGPTDGPKIWWLCEVYDHSRGATWTRQPDEDDIEWVNKEVGRKHVAMRLVPECAAANPATIRALLARLDAAEAALRDARSVVSSINSGRANELTINDEKVYWQRDEWVRWALDEVLPTIDAALSTQQQEAVPGVRKLDRSFRWDGEALQHVPQLLVEFDPVPANGPCDAKGWKDRDALAAALAKLQAAPQADIASEAFSAMAAHVPLDNGWKRLAQDDLPAPSPEAVPDDQRAKAINALMSAAALLSPLVEDGKPIRIGEARGVLRHLRETRIALTTQQAQSKGGA